MVQRRTAPNGQGEKQSAVVQQFSSGFVRASSETDAEKQAQRSWDRSSLLAVKDDDAQVDIYNAYARNANTDAEGKNTRKGLGAGSGGGMATGGKRALSFVSQGGAPANTAASALSSFVSAGGKSYQSGTGGSSSSSSSSSAATAACAYAAAAAYAAPAPLPPGWTATQDPATEGRSHCVRPVLKLT